MHMLKNAHEIRYCCRCDAFLHGTGIRAHADSYNTCMHMHKHVQMHMRMHMHTGFATSSGKTPKEMGMKTTDDGAKVCVFVHVCVCVCVCVCVASIRAT
jgi:hypothetical protein